jgi:GT2 family glycosyltransferase
MPHAPRTALVLLTYKATAMTLECLESLAKSGPDAFTVFLVNNHPQDESGVILIRALESSGLPHRYIESPVNGGFSGGMNLGIRAALAEDFSHIGVLNNDTTVSPDFGSRLLHEISRHPGAVLAGSIVDAATGLPSHGIGVIEPRTLQVRHVFEIDYAGKVDFVSGCFLVAPSGVWNRVGIFRDDYFMYAEDVELSLRLKKADVPIVYCPSLTIRHQGGASADKSQMPKDYYRMRNQTHSILLHGSRAQKSLYFGYLALLLIYKLRNPPIFMQFVRGIRDAVRGRLGRLGPGGA